MIASVRHANGVRLMAVVLMAAGLVAIARPPLGASDGVPTPVSITLELDDQRCGPLLLLAPAGKEFALRIQNDSSGELVLALPPDGARVVVAAQESATVPLQLEAGAYGVSCGDALGGQSIVLEAVNGFGLPSSPTATPVASS